MKIVDLDELAGIVARLKKKGKKVVHCHGVFDLLHIGHIRHFEEARKMGGALVVTLTPDEYVNKGPHRPAFKQQLRAEAIASLSCVDYVAINRWPSAVETIQLLKPSIYAKGPDYKDARRDVTGGIKKEAAAVKKAGGVIRYTEDVTFSSSELINRHVPMLPPEVKNYFDAFRKKFKPGDIVDSVQKLQKLKVLVVGETILDEYIYCTALGKSSKEPILAMQRLREEMSAGGVLAIANHLAEFCGKVDILTYLGKDDPREKFVRSHLAKNIRPYFIYKKNSPTIVKRRYVENYLLSKMFEVYSMNDELLDGKEERDFCSFLEKRLREYDVVVAADYGHGMMTPKAIDILSRKAKFLSVNTQINAANLGFHTVSKYPRADYICIHEGEIRLEHRTRTEKLEPMVERLSRKMKCGQIMVTRGKTGTLFYRKGDGFFHCPSFAFKVVDRIGAGDAVLALTSLLAKAGFPAPTVGFLGNLVGAQAVMIVGNRSSIEKTRLLKTVESVLK